MPAKPGSKQPKYRLHKTSGRAVVTLVDSKTRKRRDVWLGKHGTPESRAKYHNIIGAWEANGRRLDDKPEAAQAVGGVSVRSTLDQYREYIQTLVSPTHGMTIARALQLTIDQYGDTSAARFGPLKLKDVRLTMVGLGWQRDTINKGVQIITRAFEWAASEELVAASVHGQLCAVQGLKPGELGTADGDGVPAAPEAAITKAREHLPRQIVAMIDLQLLTGMRPGEVVLIRAVDITAAGKVWYYDPPTHKTAHLGKDRRVRLGPRCIEIIKPFMLGQRVDAYLFDPRQAHAEQKAANATTRRRANQKPNKRKTQRSIGAHYTVDSYRRAVTRACDAASTTRWTPRQLRKNGLIRLEQQHGLEAASKYADHADATVTLRHYLERDNAMLDRIALESA
ncbi:MAG: tyrosine-type recombinase/integrase [Planctomycetota bacterium]